MHGRAAICYAFGEPLVNGFILGERGTRIARMFTAAEAFVFGEIVHARGPALLLNYNPYHCMWSIGASGLRSLFVSTSLLLAQAALKDRYSGHI